MDLEGKLKNLDLEFNRDGLFQDGIMEEDLVDVTQFFDDSASSLQTKTIIKEPNFNLFEGTHSLEVENKKLDSTSIQLTPAEANFECNALYGSDEKHQLSYVVGILDRLVRSVVCWLNDYQTLPTTVLSCRYVEHLLLESEKKGQLVFLHTGHPLFDQILCSGIYGVCYFARFVQRLLKAGVIFEEEDLNFNGMGLNFLSYVEDGNSILSLLQESIRIASLCSDSEVLIHILKLLIHLVSIEKCLDEFSTDVSHLNALIEEATYLSQQPQLSNLEIPAGSFSIGIQRRLSNQFPPKSLIIPPRNYEGFIVMAQDLKKVLQVDNANTMMEIMQFANFFNKFEQRHVLARALFPLFLIRDNRTILGRYTLSEFTHGHLLEFSLMCTMEVDFPPEITEQPLMEAANVLFEWYQNTSQNTSRYRQGYNRQLLLWDSLQAQIEAMEVEWLSKDSDAAAIDYVEMKEGEEPTPLLPYTSWVYAMKVRAMIEFILKGFDLQVYKPFETYTMYWYTYYLAHQWEICLKKVQKFVDSKINAIHGLNKKVKKSKSGEKRELLKAQYRFAMDNHMGQLQVNKRFLQYLIVESSIFKSLSIAQVFQFGILTSYGLIDNKSPAKNNFTTNELLYNLRMKPFCSIGVPELLPYELMESTFKEFVPDEPMFTIKLNKAMECLHKELNESKLNVEHILKCIQGGDNNGVLVTATRLVKSEATKFYEGVKTSIETLETNSKKIQSTLGSKRSPSLREKYAVQLQFCEGGSSFFPVLSLTSHTSKKSHINQK
ncbi:ZYRO0D12408p [Zygosaccharomyces rouxii]|uniref:ZYRO0D12408p n=1 Tax=Zygosaccharomyces rouxii (strain ATCC 2623 / CBS 732 / NBRC 1130 / NCYC 568 / NRRL Y-229) TaxID=559307 RepID=C5DW70_ZYGRC|nr:uncharacterized protein ZYRO0D12408g [Zygosaccharomyces rouxii]KAH9200948.1 Mak10 subunit, NatC N-terminal acetyltransferase-domain-containing protein [Zygosaccharomyces rouxii]CAR28039.1 ZYRO0D12408p [Zygosaccharomyces rouxii]